MTLLEMVKDSAWRKRLLDSTRGQILILLRVQDRTVDEIATALRLTDNAIRAHLVGLERDGLIERVGTRAGLRKPHALYSLTHAAEQVFPKSYGRLVNILVDVMARKVSGADLRSAMREVGRRIAMDYIGKLAGKKRSERIKAGLRVLGELGGVTTVEKSNGTTVVRGRGCPIAAITAQHREGCLIAESLLAEVTGRRVKEHCRRGSNPSCCFEIS